MLTKAPSLGQTLIRQGLITEQQLDEALAQQRQTRERLGEVLVRLGLVTDWDLQRALAEQLGHGLFDPNKETVEAQALELVSADFAREHQLLPVRVDDRHLVVAMVDPLDVEALDHLQRVASRIDRDLEILLAPASVLDEAREANYRRLEGKRSVDQLIEKVVDEVGENDPDPTAAALAAVEDDADEAGIIDLVDKIIARAILERATDIHIEPLSDSLLIRYRVDGVLYDAVAPPRAVYASMLSRLKIMANMDIAERRAAQDGRFSFNRDGHEVDVRVSVVPTVHGEKMVMRLLDKSAFDYSLSDLGFSPEDLTSLQRAIHRPHGMILLSGPTGSGKTTTLYACLRELPGESLNITTIEDPVEYQIDRINQVQVNVRKNLTFANALRAFLRQDPDVIMVGEIRDQETAEIAIRASLTGHLVFSTIHANDAPSTAARLVSMGAEPFMAASALTLVAAQRLVRRSCPHCLQEYEPEGKTLMGLGLTDEERGELPERFVRGVGCPACQGRGYKGRVAVIERLEMSPAIRELVAARRPAGEIRRQAISEGMTTLLHNGLTKVREGITTVEEVLRVCASE